MSEPIYVGIVLAGGGGKGAYEVGAWEALQKVIKECNLSPIAFSGASVGALNAALFACNSSEKSRKIWGSVTPEKVLSLNKESINKITKNRTIMGMLAATTSVASLLVPISPFLRLMHPLLGGYDILNNGLFSQEGIKLLITENVPSNKITSYFVFVSVTKGSSVDYNCLDACNYVDALLASSALPFVFGGRKIPDSAPYCRAIPYWGRNDTNRDGGLTDNLPLLPLLELRDTLIKGEIFLNHFIVIHLDDNVNWEKMKYPLNGCKFYHIFPSKSLHGLLGTVDFRPESISKNIILGELDVLADCDQMDCLARFFNSTSKKDEHYYKGKIYNSLKEVYKAARKNRLKK